MVIKRKNTDSLTHSAAITMVAIITKPRTIPPNEVPNIAARQMSVPLESSSVLLQMFNCTPRTDKSITESVKNIIAAFTIVNTSDSGSADWLASSGSKIAILRMIIALVKLDTQTLMSDESNEELTKQKRCFSHYTYFV